jgi:DNA-binding protein Fis
MYKIIFLFIFTLTFTFFSCQNFGPNPQDLVGNYNVSFSLKEDIIDNKSIRDSINYAFEKAAVDIEKAKRELDEELNLSSLDTSQLEGKIEYAAKSFSKSIADIGLNFGGLGKDLGGLISGIATSTLGLTEAI